MLFSFFFFNDTATTEIYTLSLHDALPISARGTGSEETRMKRDAALTPGAKKAGSGEYVFDFNRLGQIIDRKSTRLNSSHGYISYAVFCLKKKKQSTNLSVCANIYSVPYTI